MKKFVLMATILLSLTSFTAHANTLTVINNTGCKYVISTQGGYIDVLPNWSQTYVCPAKVSGPNNNCNNPMYPTTFINAKVIYGSIQVNVGTAGPTTASSSVGVPCNNNNPFTVSWLINASGDITLIIY